MKTVTFLYPGQGSQYVGMAKNLIDNPIAKKIIEEAESVLGYSIKDLMINGPEEELKKTEKTQPAILTHSFILTELLQSEGVRPNLVLGHSIGEYGALLAAGSISFTEAVKAVQLRGKFMQESVPEEKGSMVAILKVDLETIQRGCQEVSENGSEVMPANINSPGQVVVSGHKEATDKFCAWLESNFEGSFRAIPLKVSAPFHSSLMRPAQLKLAEHFKEVQFKENVVPYIANIDAQLYNEGTSPSKIKTNCIEQVSGSVLWQECFSQVPEDSLCLEVGPGKTLMGLGRSINRKVKIITLDQEEPLNIIKELQL